MIYMIDRQNLNDSFDDRKKAYLFVVSVVLLIVIILAIFIIPQVNSIKKLIGAKPGVVATLNGQPLTNLELITYNCNRYGVYVSKCKTNYQGQLNNFVNYEVEVQYLKEHNALPTKKEVYSFNSINLTSSIGKVNLATQLYNYSYQNLVKLNIENLLEKNVSGTVIGSIYSWYTIGFSGKIPYGSRKKYAQVLIAMWRNNIVKNPSYIQNINTFLLNSPYLGFVTNYKNLNINNYQSLLTTYTNFPMFNNIINQKIGNLSQIYNYDNSNIKNIGNKFIGIYYFIIPNKTQGVYSNYNEIINYLRSKDNIVIY